MSELVLRSAMERLQSSMLSEGTSPLDPSISTDLNSIVKQLNQMIVLLKGITKDKDKVRQIDELSYHIKDAIESRPTIWGFNRFKNMLLDLRLRKMKTIIRQIEVDPAIHQSATVPVQDEHINIVGLDDDRSRLVSNLLSSSSLPLSVSPSSHFGVPVFPICGGVGSGKTTLAKSVYDDPNVGKRFRIRIWIDVRDKFEIGHIVKQIIDCGHEWMSYFSKEDQVEQIKKVLSSERSLIVLEDIRSMEAWKTLCRILPRLFEGSYVLVTTRVIHVAENISPKQFVYNMNPLNERDSLALFTKLYSSDATTTTSSTETDSGFETSFRRANLSSDTDTDNNRERGMITEMVRHCNGSPQLIKDLALYLKSKPSEEWETILRDIRAHLSEFCCRVYNELPDHLKPCFMYLGHFLEDQEIDPEKLSHLWTIESLLPTRLSARGGERMMDMTERYLRELALKGMVEVEAEEVPAASGGSKKLKSCRFTQGMEDFCVSNCEHKGFLKIVDLRREDYSLSSTKGEPARLVIYLGKHNVHIPRKVAKNIRSLRVVLLGNQQQQVTKLLLKLEDYQGLRILDFDRIDFQREKLPSEIFNLKHLRYLSFKGCILNELQSSITNLSYLQVLDLRVEYGPVETKISNFIGKMRRLKHLYLPQRFTTQNGEKLRLDGLTELETLVNFNTRVCRANDVSKLCKLEHLTAKVEENFDDFESITNYMKLSSCSNNWPRLHCSVDIVDLDCYSEERHSVLREFLQCKVLGTLQLKGFIGRLPPPYDDQISRNLTQLVLNESYLKEDPMPTLEKLPRLGILVLSDDAYMGKKMVCSASGFPQLKCLQLLNLSSLQTLEVHHTSMPQMNNCPKLHNCSKLLEILITHSHRGMRG